MKRIYLKPEIFNIQCIEETIMLTESESARNIGGGPTQDSENPLTPGVNDWKDENQDPYANHGPGSGGAGNRSKTGMIWDEW